VAEFNPVNNAVSALFKMYGYIVKFGFNVVHENQEYDYFFVVANT
jgi:hypothetical protein